MQELGLYIHIPFCMKKCHYCDFASFSRAENKIEAYIDGLVIEIESWKERAKDSKIKTIFLGGGTPTIVPIRQMDRIIESLHRNFRIKNGIEFSIEGNPGTLDKEKLQFYQSSHINRISMGLQAWQDELLNRLGRVHSQRQFIENYHLAREMGFKNINIDLMFGLPNQTMDHWKETLHHIVELKPEHLSAYGLKVEEGTIFDTLYEDGKLNLPTEETDRAMYDYTITFLQHNGYIHYEISNFAQKGMECAHNKIYWENNSYIGLGLNAHSYFDHQRFSNTGDLEEYIVNMKSGKGVVVENIPIGLPDEMAETMFLGLRMLEGINISLFKHRFGVNPLEFYREKIEKCVRFGLLEVYEDTIRLSRKGIDLSNQVFLEFLPDEQ